MFEFFALHPVAYHYFMPGLLLGTLESIGAEADCDISRQEAWVDHLTSSKDRLQMFKEEYLPLFSPEQRDAVASHLEFFNEWCVEHQGYADAYNKSFERALSEIWRAES